MKKLNLVLGILVGFIVFSVSAGVVAAMFPPGLDKANMSQKVRDAVEEHNPNSPNFNLNTWGPQEFFVKDEIIVKFKGDVKPFRAVKIREGSVGEKIAEYSKRGDVEYAEPNYIAHTMMVPNDPYYGYQWNLDNSKYGGINMEEAWDISTGTDVVVAVVDTGIAYENYGWRYRQAPDLAKTCFVQGYDFVNNDVHPNDDNSHGTHVAGTIAQSANNNIGVAGIAFNTHLMPIKVLDRNGFGNYSDIAEGIIWATNNGAKVINLSLGGPDYSETLENAVQYAYDHGVVVVAAAGNGYEEGNILQYPAAYDDYVIAVGATRYDETRSYYSNTGAYLDLMAPGGDTSVDQNIDGYVDGILQNTFNPDTKNTRDFGYWFFQGTSMATPHISGAAALLIANGNAVLPDDVRNALQETAEDLGDVGRDDVYGYGLVDAYAALQWTSGPVCSSDADCDDGNSCTSDVCVNPGVTGAYCSNTPVNDGVLCDDGLFCTLNDVCSAGVCGGEARDCSDTVNCTIDSCDEANDMCAYVPDDSLCDNGLYCDGSETCSASLGCEIGDPVNCDDSNECTLDVCDEDNDNCSYMNVGDETSCDNETGICCSGNCLIGASECSLGVLCWEGSLNKYLYRKNDQAKKFCRCVQGSYGYENLYYKWGRKTVYKYTDAGNNENWGVSSRFSYIPVYGVKCLDNVIYQTNQDYWQK